MAMLDLIEHRDVDQIVGIDLVWYHKSNQIDNEDDDSYASDLILEYQQDTGLYYQD